MSWPPLKTRSSLRQTHCLLTVRPCSSPRSTVTNVAFEAWSCYEFMLSDNTTKRYLTADVGVECGDTPEYTDVLWLAWFAILLYPVGLMLFCGALLYLNRYTIGMGKSTAFSKSISFLHADFNTNYFFWELAEMFRRFVLVGVLGLDYWDPGSVIQLTLATLFCIVYLVVQVQTSPFALQSDSFVAVVVSAMLVVFFLMMLIYKYAVLLELANISAALTPHQDELYRPGTLLITIFMVAAITLVICAAAAVAAYNAYMEYLRLRRADLALKARRLRYVKTQLSVPAPRTPGDNWFHIFLSHVWGTGQDQMRIVKTRLLDMIEDLKVFLDVDDLEDISDLEGYIDRTVTMFIYCSKGYFESKNCMRELVATFKKKKPVIAVMDLDLTRGGLTKDMIQSQLSDTQTSYSKWGFPADTPSGEELFEYLFQDEPLEWNRTCDIRPRALPAHPPHPPLPLEPHHSSPPPSQVSATSKM